jgi:hypothetical protein
VTHEIFLNSKPERQVFGVAGRALDSCAGVGGFRLRPNISGTTKVFGVAGWAWDSCAGVGGFRLRPNVSGTTSFWCRQQGVGQLNTSA